MVFDGDRLDVQELRVPRDLHYVIVDLHAQKDTKEILSKLNRCYPFAENDLHRSVQQYLGPISARITHDAAEALLRGRRGAAGRADERGAGRVRPPSAARPAPPS